MVVFGMNRFVFLLEAIYYYADCSAGTIRLVSLCAPVEALVLHMHLAFSNFWCKLRPVGLTFVGSSLSLTARGLPSPNFPAPSRLFLVGILMCFQLFLFARVSPWQERGNKRRQGISPTNCRLSFSFKHHDVLSLLQQRRCVCCSFCRPRLLKFRVYNPFDDLLFSPRLS